MFILFMCMDGGGSPCSDTAMHPWIMLGNGAVLLPALPFADVMTYDVVLFFIPSAVLAVWG